MSITLQAKDGIFITSDSDGVVRTCDIFTGLCKASFQTPAKGADKRDIQLVNGRLVLVWHADQKIKIWDVEKEELLHTVDGPGGLQDIKIAEDGSRVFSIGARVIQAQSIQTGKIVGKAGIKFLTIILHPSLYMAQECGFTTLCRNPGVGLWNPRLTSSSVAQYASTYIPPYWYYAVGYWSILCQGESYWKGGFLAV
jgi:hypothetical protein